MTSETKHDDRNWDAPTVDPSVEVLLEQTFNYPRVEIVLYLRNHSDETTTLDDLGVHLCNLEAERGGERPDQNQMTVKLHHNHLPALADAGVIEYDPSSKEVRYEGEENASIEFLLSQLTG